MHKFNMYICNFSATPLDLCRLPKPDEILYSHRGSPVTDKAHRQSSQQRAEISVLMTTKKNEVVVVVVMSCM